jgi:nucleoid-associated protein YgaU
VTRESKLALMIAVTLILLVGVLLSDHLSGATEAQFEDAPVARKAPTPVAALPGSAGDGMASLPAAEPASLAAAVDPQAGPSDGFVFEPEPLVIAQGPAERGGLIGEALGGVDGAIQRVRASDPPVLMQLFKPVEDEAVTLPPRDPGRVAPVKPIGEPEARQAGVVPGAAIGGAPVASWKTHTVVAGDNLYRLAARYLGDGDRWPELRAMNADLLGGGETVQVGMLLRVAPGEARSTPAAGPAKPAPAAASGPATSHREYVVLKGDMLSTISQKLLGTVRRMDEIVKLNGLKDPDDIRVGQTLKIPAR